MTTINLFDWFKTGYFGPIALGMPREEVLALLGKPDDTGISGKHGRPAILRYGDYEFHFTDDRLWLIHNDHFTSNPGGNSLHVLGEGIAPDITMDKAIGLLEAQGVPFDETTEVYAKGTAGEWFRLLLVSSGGVQLLFEPGLTALSASTHR